MVTLDAIKGTWMEPRVNCILHGSAICLTEAATKSFSEVPKHVRKPASRGGITRTNFPVTG